MRDFFSNLNKTTFIKPVIKSLYIATFLVSSEATAGAIYDPGTLTFTLEDQSLWGPGTGTTPSNSFNQTTWDSTLSFGGIAGEENFIITPAVPSVQLTPYIPATYAPSWYESRVHIGYDLSGDKVYAGCGCTRGGGKITDAISATYSPYVPAVTTDTRTGSIVSLSSQGSLSINSDLGFNSGTLDARLEYSTNFTIPDKIEAGVFFDLQGNSSLDNGKLDSVFPKLTGKVEVGVENKVTYSYNSCFIGAGCTGDNGTIMDVDTGLFPILELNTANVPDAMSLFGLDEAAFDVTKLTVWVDFNPVGTPPITVSLPGAPTNPVAINIGALTLDYPDLTTSGGLDDGKLTSSNSFDDVIRLDADIDGLLAANGLIPPLGLVFSAGPLSLRGDLFDIDLGPTIDLFQDLEITSTLMVQLNFTNDVYLKDADGNITTARTWQGKLSDLPQIALINSGDRIEVTPTYWVESDILNKIGLGFDITAGIDILKAQAFFSIISTPEFCLICNDMPIPVGKTYFEPVRFSSDFKQRTTAQSFTLAIVPEPGVFFLFVIGCLAMGIARRRI